ncbi:hypothetical protein MBLNU457_3981t1 [Dothideomycetes sp. NU457]
MAADVPQFQYRPLATNEIRLLYLVPNHMNPNQLHLRLVHTAFEPTPVYQALSYVWGRPLEEHLLEVLCSSEPTSKESGLAGAPSLSSMVQSPRSESYFGDDTTGRMRITPNLHAALAAIRPSKEFPMWVDAISINQKDNMQEKQEQVLRMHEIFQLAEEVIIWFHPSFERQEGPLRRAHGRKVYFGPIPDGTEVSIELYRWLEAYMEDEDVMFEGFPRLLRRFETSHDDIDGYPSFTPEQVRNLGRRFFATEKGHFGWANVGTEAGDNVCVFLGHEVLYLLTPPETKTVNGRLGAYREFRSPAYVHGMMMGEALKDFKEGEHEMFNII